MNYPERLREGDTVALLAPSSPISAEDAAACRCCFEERGYGVRMSGLVSAALHGYEAGEPEARAEELNAAFADPGVKAIFCLRGGNSACRVLEHVDLDTVRANPKIFVGYSDITPFHVLFNQRADLITFHGPMVKSNMLRDFDAFSRASLDAALSMEPGSEMEFYNPEGSAIEEVCGGAAEGRLAGGNLALLTSLLGTPYAVDTRGKILLIEDVGETVPRVARMLHHLRLAGKFEEAAGVLIGDFTDCPNAAEPAYGVEALIRDFFSGFGKPVLAGVRTGHDFPMATLPLGMRCRVDAARGSVRFSRD